MPLMGIIEWAVYDGKRQIKQKESTNEYKKDHKEPNNEIMEHFFQVNHDFTPTFQGHTLENHE